MPGCHAGGAPGDGNPLSDSIRRSITAQALSNDLSSLIDHAHLGDRVVLVGHSRGGLNVRHFAYQHPERVAGDPDLVKAPLSVSQYAHQGE